LYIVKFKEENKMAKNPMQRRANTSFILGILITLLITGIVIVFLVMQLLNAKETIKTFEANKVKVYVLKQAVSSGQTITQDMLTLKDVDKSTVPENAITGENIDLLRNYYLEDANGNSISTNAFGELYVAISEQNASGQTVTNIYVITEQEEKYYRYRNPETAYSSSQVKQNSNGYYVTTAAGDVQVTEIEGSYYAAHQSTGNEEKVEYALSQVPMVAKIDMATNTVLTNYSITKSTEKVSDDLRRQEYSVIVISSQIETGDCIDIRLRMPDGTDYIVASHKEVEIPMIGETDSPNTISIQVTEDEIVTISNAIVESYMVPGSMIYASKYVEPGLQEKAIPTYLPSQKVKTLIDQNPNVTEVAKQALNERYANGTNRNNINDVLNQNAEDAADNVTDKTEEEITLIQEERQEYLESLAG
jgi:type II secretory pathway pseudopilin PulG